MLTIDPQLSESEVTTMFVRNGTAALSRVLTCPPSYLQRAAPINEISKKYVNQPLDQTKLKAEYRQLVEIYHQIGVTVEQLTPTIEMPNAVFSRDFGGCVREGYILGRFKKSIRFKESTAYEHKMADLGIPKLGEVVHGFFEGGDFAFLADNVVAIGMLDRTDQTGFDEIKAMLSPLGYQVYPVKAASRYLHLDMCFNLVADHLAVAYVQGLPPDFLSLLSKLAIKLIPVPETAIFKHGCNLESLGHHRVISLKQNQAVNVALRSAGMSVLELNAVETLKAGGGPHCMTFPLHRV